MRPPQSFYDRVVYLMDTNRAAGFDPARMLAEARFCVNDIGIVCILQRASRDLAVMCRQLGDAAAADELELRCHRTHEAVNALWSTHWQQPVSRNVLTGELLDEPTSAGLLAAYAGFDVNLESALQAVLLETPFGIPSTRASAKGFEPLRYWRGPVWQHMNLLIGQGLQEQGYQQPATTLAAMSRRLFEQSGFCEYYHPLTGQGLGGSGFSWTAASYLHSLG